MNTLSAHTASAQHSRMPARGWRLDTRRAMSLRPQVPSRLQRRFRKALHA